MSLTKALKSDMLLFSFHKQTKWPISFVINLKLEPISPRRFKLICVFGGRDREESRRFVIQGILLYMGSEQSAEVEEEMNGHAGGLVYHLCICVQGHMMDVCSNCDSRCCLQGRGIIECEGFLLKVGPVSAKDKDTYLPKLRS